MFELSHFYDYCQQNNVDIIPFDGMPSEGATIRDGSDYAIFLDFTKLPTLRQIRGVCMHELGHTATGALHKVSSPFETVERSEHRAIRYTAEAYLTADGFRQAFAAGARELWELADYFDLPEEDVRTAYAYWTQNRGISFTSPPVSNVPDSREGII